MRTRWRLTVMGVLALGLTLSGSGKVQAGLMGDSVDTKYLFPTQGTVFTDLGTQVVNPVATFNSFGQTQYDVSDSTIRITNTAGTPIFFLSGAFNGVSVTDVTQDPHITGVLIDPVTNLAGFDASRVSFTDSAVFVNLQSLTTEPNTVVQLDLEFASTAVPEPSSLALLAFGGAALAGWRRWRKRTTA